VQWLPAARKYAKKTLYLAGLPDSLEMEGIANESVVRAARVWQPHRGPFEKCLISWVRLLVAIHKTHHAQVVSRPRADFGGDFAINWLDAPLPSGKGTFADLLEGVEEAKTDGMDAARVCRAVEQVILRALSGSKHPRASLEIWTRKVTDDECSFGDLGAEYGFSRQAAEKRFKLAQAAVDAWADGLRREAA